MDNNEILRYFFQAYFHQDWADDYSTSMVAVQSFIKREKSELHRLLKDALSMVVDKNEISDDFIYENGGHYSPKFDGIEMKEWLKSIIDLL